MTLTATQMIRLARQRAAAGAPTLVPLADAAHITGLHTNTVLRWIGEARVRRYPGAGRSPYRVDLAQVVEVRDRSSAHPEGCPLTYNQIDVLRRYGNGLSAQDIADERGCSIHAIRGVTRAAIKGLDARGYTNAVAIALAAGFLTPQEIDIPHVTCSGG